MIDLAEVRVDVTLDEGGFPGWAEGVLEVALTDPGAGPDDIATLDVELDSEGVRAAYGLAGTQLVWLRFSLDGEPLLQLAPECFYEDNLEGYATWGFTVPVSGEKPHPLGGSFLHYSGPPPGKRSITIDGIYFTSSGPKVIRLLTDGVTATCRQTFNGGSWLEAVSGLDRAGRFDRRKTNYTLPPGHGLTRDVVGRRFLEKLGWNQFLLGTGTRSYREIQGRDIDLGWLREYWEAEGRTFKVDPYGRATNPLLAAPSGARADWTFGFTSLLNDQGVEIEGVADAPTSITLTGTRQIVKEACGRRTVVEESLQYTDAAPQVASFRQAADGTLTPYVPPPAPPVTLHVTSLVRTTTEYDCETIASQRVETFAEYNPQTWRYKLQGTTLDYAIDSYHEGVYILEPGAVAGDSSSAHIWPVARFVRVSEVLTTPEYDDRGFKAKEFQRSQRYRLPRWRLKIRLGATPWEETNWRAMSILGNGDAVIDPSIGGRGTEAIGFLRDFGMDVERSLTVYEVDDLGYVHSETVYVYRLYARPGRDFLFNGYEAADEQETLQLAEIRRVAYLPAGEANHDVVATRVDASGRFLENPTEERGRPGYLPAAARRNDIEPKPETYASAEEGANGRPASRAETQPIKATVQMPADVAADREEYELKEALAWAESPEECLAGAARLLRELSALKVTVSLVANFLVRVGQVMRFPTPEGWMRAHIKKVRHEGGAKGTLTKVTGAVDVF